MPSAEGKNEWCKENGECFGTPYFFVLYLVPVGVRGTL